ASPEPSRTSATSCASPRRSGGWPSRPWADAAMKIGLSTSVIQRGRSGVGQYVLALTRALLPAARRHEFTLFVLEEDRPLFGFAESAMRIVPVPERVRPPLADI